MKPKLPFTGILAIFIVLNAAHPCFAADAESEWNALIALDAGPQPGPGTEANLQAAIAAHVQRQEQALRAFLSAHANDPHAFEAKLRLARLLAIRSRAERSEKLGIEAERILEELRKGATADQRGEVDFASISLMMRRLSHPIGNARDELLRKVQKFHTEYPEDRRLPALLAEIASLFDAQPKIQRSLLLDAQAQAKDDELKSRIADDLRRLDLLGQPVSLKLPALSGSEIDLEKLRGQNVLLIFFALWSPPSLQAFDNIIQWIAPLPKGAVQLIGISLDSKREPLVKFLKEQSWSYPIGYDGLTWESPAIRALGINGLPTVWLLDRKGRLRSLNAAEGTADQVRQLLKGP